MDNVFTGESELGEHFIKHLSNLNIRNINLKRKEYMNTHDFPMAGSSSIYIGVSKGWERRRIKLKFDLWLSECRF